MTMIASIPETDVAAKLHVPVTFAPYTRNAFILQPGSIVEVVDWMGDTLTVRFAGRDASVNVDYASPYEWDDLTGSWVEA